MPGHIALLGDSIFDNGAYTAGEPDVITHLRSQLPLGWGASLGAIDGSRIVHIPDQCADLPPEATHLVLSVGGNDALLQADLLDLPVGSTAKALLLFAERRDPFAAAYATLVDSILDHRVETILCTIYEGRFDPDEAALARVALMMFNDAILRIAFARKLPVIDLRLVCSEASDYANPIEPSGSGGRKIAAAVARACGVETEPGPSRVFGR